MAQSRSGASRIIRATGRVVINPTEAFAGGEFPYGGTDIGRVNAVALRSLGSDYKVNYEGLGAVGDILEGGLRWTFSCFLRGWDDDAVKLLLADGYEKGAQTQHAVFKAPGGKQPGTSALARLVKVAFVPDDLTHASGVLIYSALPDWDGGMAFARKTEFGIPLVFECMLDSQGRILAIGRMADLEL